MTASASHQILGLPARTALIAATLYLLATLAYTLLWVRAPISAPDSSSYHAAAQDLLDGDLDALQFRPPGYPLLLIMTGSAVAPTKALFVGSLLLHFAASWLLLAMLNALGFRERVLWVAMVLLALPPYLENAAYVLSESLTEFVLVLLIASLAFWLIGRRNGWLIVASLVLGVSSLVRPSLQYLGVPLIVTIAALYWLFRRPLIMLRQVGMASGVLLAGALVLIGGWSALNASRFGFFGLNPGGLGWSLSTQTAPFIEQLPDEYAEARDVLVKYRDEQMLVPGSSHTGRQYYDNAAPELSRVTGMEGEALDQYVVRINLALISEAPLNFLMSVIQGSASYWLMPYTTIANMGSGGLQLIWSAYQMGVIVAFFVITMVVFGALLIEMTRWVQGNRRDVPLARFAPVQMELGITALIWALLVYNMFISTVIHYGETRYRTPLDALILVCCFLGVRVWGWLARGEVQKSRTM
jgi:hypothetical protein